MEESIVWESYDLWNSCLAEHLYGPLQADVPAYLDMDLEVVTNCAAKQGVPDGKALESLIKSVKQTLELSLGERPLDAHTMRFTRWRRDLVEQGNQRSRAKRRNEAAPPVLALLAVCVLAAQRMGSDTSQAAIAYYPRLGELLSLSPDQVDRLHHAFPVTEIFWRGLNEYLESYEGKRGLPTAYALGHRYVGIPQSQALVRAADRKGLPEFFRRFELAPGSELVATDVERLLDIWITATPSPVSANLQSLWKRESARERVAEIVGLELSHWDGTSAKHDSGSLTQGTDVKLLAMLRKGFGDRSLELSFAARLSSHNEISQLRVLSAEETPLISVRPIPGGRIRPIPGTKLDGASLVGAVVDFEDPTTGEVATRRPRRVVPMRLDELVGALVEVDRVQLADDTVLLVKDEPEVLGAVLDLLKDVGHIGDIYGSKVQKQRLSLPGIPDGWVLINDVQIYRQPQEVKKLDLHCLIPLSSTQLNLAGGLRMPGKIRRWSMLRPPEIRAVAEDARKVRVTITELAEERTLLEERETEGEILVVSLNEVALKDGNYEIEMFLNSDAQATKATTLRLRSADTPDGFSWETCTRLNYQLDRGSNAALSASEADETSEILVDGLISMGESDVKVTATPAPVGALWVNATSVVETTQPTITLGQVDSKSCVQTGKHYIVLPTWLGGKKVGQIQGTCSNCGLTKTFPSSGRQKTNFPGSQQTNISFQDLPRHADLGATWDECLDAIVHVGGGNIGSLERIALQAESSSMFMDNFVRTLEILGHIDIRRDDFLRPVEWEANPAFLAETCEGSFVLAGVWSTATRRILEHSVLALGGDVDRLNNEQAPTSWIVRGLTASTLDSITNKNNLDCYVVPKSVERMLGVLPPLSRVELGLPKRPIPNFDRASIFDLKNLTWAVSPGVGGPGAYRLEQAFRRIHVWVDHEGALNRTARQGSVQLVKHLAALHSAQPLIGYLEQQSTLVAPTGADLPGLYGRVASLCSGLPPRVSTRTRSLGYPGVPTSVADHLTALFQS